MRKRFSFRLQSQTEIKAIGRKAKKPRRKKRAAMAAGALLCTVTPPAIFQMVLYRQNLAMARETLPLAPTLSERDRVLILAPHCDDETLGAGGTIAAARQRGIPVHIAFLTNGDGSRSTQIAVDARQLRRSSFQQLAKLRQKEALDAARALGVAGKDVSFLGYPDGGTKKLWLNHWSRHDLYRSPFTGTDRSPYDNSRTPQAPHCGQQVLADVSALLREFKPTVVITTHPHDTHPDHQAAYEFAAAALEQLRLQTAESWAQRVKLLTFLVHHGLWPVPRGYHPTAELTPPAALRNTGTAWMHEELDAPARKAKKRALESYPSQLAFTPQYLRSFLRRNELFGIVPPQSAPAAHSELVAGPHAVNSETTTERNIVVDPVRDSVKHDLLSASDLQSIAVLPPHSSDVLTLRLQTASAPSSRLRYRLWLHAFGEKSGAPVRLSIRWNSGAWRALLLDRNGTRQIAMRPLASGFEVDLPQDEAGDTLLISGESLLSGTRLDATATGTLRLHQSKKRTATAGALLN